MKRKFFSREHRMPTVVFVVTLLFCACNVLTAQTQAGSLAYLSKHIGENPATVLKTQPLQRRIIALIGATEYKSLIFNMDVANPLTQENTVLYFAGNAPHRGREEEGAVMIDPAKDSVEVFLLHNGSIVRGWAENNRLVAIPKEVQQVLNNWPREQLVQAMTAMRHGASTATNGSSPAAVARSAAPTATAATPSVCQAGTKCSEVSSLAATVTDFRTSAAGRFKIVTATVRFTNKLNRPLTIGLVQNSGVAIDDQGNRYVINGADSVRGIGLIYNSTFDPKFTLQPGESADGRIEFALPTSNNIIYGTSWEASISIREIDPVGTGQYRMGRENDLRFEGLVNRMAGSTVAASAAAGDAPVTAAASSAPGIVPASAASGATTAAGNLPAAIADACNGAPKCYSTPLYTATINSITSTANGRNHLLRFELRFRNITNQPVILAYGAKTSGAVDNLGNQYYWGRAGSYDTSAQGIGLVDGSKANPQFVLQPGESRNATFQVIRYDSNNTQMGTSYTYSVTIKQLEILPSQQIRETRDFAMTYPDLAPTAGGFGGAMNPQNVNDSIKQLGNIFKKR